MKQTKPKSRTATLWNILFVGAILLILLVPEVKATLQQGLMKLGFFKPYLENSSSKSSIALDNTGADQFVFSFKDASGKITDLETLKGKVVFINFWATWCGPCIAEMPSIQILKEKLKNDNNVVFIILETDGDEAKAKKFITSKNLQLPLHFATSSIPKEFYDGTLPSTVILDKTGRIAHRTKGLADYSGREMEDFIKKLSLN